MIVLKNVAAGNVTIESLKIIALAPGALVTISQEAYKSSEVRRLVSSGYLKFLKRVTKVVRNNPESEIEVIHERGERSEIGRMLGEFLSEVESRISDKLEVQLGELKRLLERDDVGAIVVRRENRLENKSEGRRFIPDIEMGSGDIKADIDVQKEERDISLKVEKLKRLREGKDGR